MTTKESHDRVAWIDAAKGIGIILVVLGHIWLTGRGNTYINSFHVPLFFFLSGYVANFDNKGFRPFIAKKIKSLVIPYICFSLFTYCYWNFIEKNISGNPINPQFAFMNIFLSPGADQYMPHNPALWFLTCLFIVTIMFYPIANIKKSGITVVILLLSSAIGYYLSLYVPSYFPWSIDVAFTGIVFYGMGFFLKNSIIVRIESNSILSLLFCCSLAAGWIISQLNGRVAMAQNFYGNYAYFYIAAYLGIASVIILSIFLRYSRVLLFLGQNSLIIFGLHFPVKRAVTAVTSRVLNISPDQVKGSFLISSLDTALTVLILLPAIYILRKYLYFVLGHRQSSGLYQLFKREQTL